MPPACLVRLALAQLALLLLARGPAAAWGAPGAGPIHVAFAADVQQWARLVGACGLLRSLSASRGADALRVWWVSSPAVTPAQRAAFDSACCGALGTPEFACSGLDVVNVVPPDDTLVHASLDEQTRAELATPANYYRFFLHSLLPASVDRVIYLDTDIIAQRPLRGLWEARLPGGAPLGAVPMTSQPRPLSKYIRRTADTERLLASFGVLDWGAPTFNNGVLLYDLGAWRAANFTAQLLELVALNSARPFYTLGTQSPMNIVFGASYAKLDATWNAVFACDPWISPGRAALAAASLVHFNGAAKPWALPKTSGDSELFSAAFPGFWRWSARFALVVMSRDPRRLPGLLLGLASVADGSDVLGEVVLISHQPEDACAGLEAAARAALPRLAVPLACVHYPDNDIQDRYRPAAFMRSPAALLLDDDTVLEAGAADLLFRAWQEHPDVVVGLQARTFREIDGVTHYAFKAHGGGMHFIIGKVMMASKALLLEYLGSERNIAFGRGRFCEDLHLSILGTLRSGKPPVVVRAGHREVDVPGLSQAAAPGAWALTRGECMRDLVRLFNTTLRALPTMREMVVGYDAPRNALLTEPILDGHCFVTKGWANPTECGAQQI